MEPGRVEWVFLCGLICFLVDLYARRVAGFVFRMVAGVVEVLRGSGGKERLKLPVDEVKKNLFRQVCRGFELSELFVRFIFRVEKEMSLAVSNLSLVLPTAKVLVKHTSNLYVIEKIKIISVTEVSGIN